MNRLIKAFHPPKLFMMLNFTAR